jgi:hypothetical protein
MEQAKVEEIKQKSEDLLGKFDDIGDSMDMLGEEGKKPEAVAAFRQAAALLTEISDWLDTLSEDEWKVLLER